MVDLRKKEEQRAKHAKMADVLPSPSEKRSANFKKRFERRAKK